MADETQNPIEDRLAAYLMTRDHISFDEGNPAAHPRFKNYHTKAETITKHLGGEDYLSLALALDDEDDGTVDGLIDKSEQNKHEDVAEGFQFVGRIPASRRARMVEWLRTRSISHRLSESGNLYVATTVGTTLRLREALSQKAKYPTNKCFEGAQMKKDRPVSYKKGDEVLYEGRKTVITVAAGPANTVGVSIKGQTVMVDRAKVTKLKEGILGMTGVTGLQRMRQLAGLVKEDEDFGMGGGLPVDDYDDAPPVVINDPVEEPADAPLIPSSVVGEVPAVLPPVGAAPAASIVPPVGAEAAISPIGTEFSPEYQEAAESLDRLIKLVHDMKISEFKMFVDKADEFHNKVKDIGRALLNDVGAV